MKQKFPHRKFLAAAAVATTLAISAAPARAAILVVDNVENDGSTTWTTTGVFANPTWTASGGFGLTAQAGSQYHRISAATTTAISGTVRRTGGFGPTFTVAAGTYTLSMFAGEGDATTGGRRSFTTFDAVLATVGGTEFVGKTVTTPYVDPATPSTADWTQTTVQYVIPEASALIGEQFTWGFNWTKTAGSGYMFGWDAVTVDFVPAGIPEPSCALLGGLGMLVLLRRRR
jgi:hypothetical protein